MQSELLEFLPQVTPGMKVLDVGCGSGRLLTELTKKDVVYTGLDFSERLLDEARKQYNHKRFLLRDVTADSTWEGLGDFDAIFCLGVLHHIPDRESQHALIQNMYKHLRPGGFMVLSVWNLWQLRFWKEHFKSLALKIANNNWQHVWVKYSISDGTRPVTTVKRFFIAFFAGQVIRLVKQVGFTVETFYYAKHGSTHMSLLTGQNFCVLARKHV